MVSKITTGNNNGGQRSLMDGRNEHQSIKIQNPNNKGNRRASNL